jgi:uncharacterized damage-inducible protein DinB
VNTLPTLGVPLLFDYLFWLRDRVLRAAEGMGDEAFRNTPAVHGRDLRATLVHEIDVELSWRGRLQGLPESAWGQEAGLDPEQYPSLASVIEHWHADERKTRDWLTGLTPAELAAQVAVNGLEGYPLEVYLLHVVEHGVTELTSAAAILHELGRSAGELGVLNALDDLAPLPRPGGAGA